ncbi:hypothetical protein Lal_00039937 [Lupinus albus]|nr:hypothetical protein Lal_00039937 [Lupinus albus]
MDRPRLLHPVGTTRSPQGSLWLLGGREQNHLSTIIAPSVLFTQGFATSVWSNEAWGSYRNWDPKVTWAFITWTIFAIYLHTRKKNWDV